MHNSILNAECNGKDEKRTLFRNINGAQRVNKQPIHFHFVHLTVDEI